MNELPSTKPEADGGVTLPQPCSSPLDPATCLALKPVHDIGDQAVKERDEWNRWSVGIAGMLNVSCSDFASDVVADQYAELRARITQALNDSSSATRP
jgi:hypothetical protein